MKIYILIILMFVSLTLEINSEKSSECVEEFKCGQRTVDHPERYNSVYNGSFYPGQWPWYSLIYVHKGDESLEYNCGGTLISHHHVITSILCVKDEFGSMLDADKFRIRVGTHKRNIFYFGYARHRLVSKIHQPIDHDKTSENEIVILEMSIGVTFNNYVQPACIPAIPYGLLTPFWPTIGWGAVEGNKDLGTLYRYVEDSNRYYYYQKHLCENDRGSITHNYEISGWDIYGIIDCFGFSPYNNGFIRVADYLPFIINVTNLEYLQKVRKGQHYDATRNYTNLLPQTNCGPTSLVSEFPWFAQLMYDDFGYGLEVLYIGTLISSRYVLSNAYSVDNRHIAKVRLGNFSRTQNLNCNLNDNIDCSLSYRDYDVEYSTFHPDYESFGDYSIALIRTTKPVLYEDHIHPVCLPVSQNLRRIEPAKYVIIGWSNMNSKLGKTAVSTVNKSRCMFHLSKFPLKVHHETKICTQQIDNNFEYIAQLGEYVSINGIKRFVQFGFQIVPGPDKQHFHYINIPNFMDWIIANMHV